MRTAALLLLASVALAGTDRRLGPPTSGNDVVDITATAYLDKETVIKMLGRDPGLDLVVVEVKVAPKADNKIAIYRDDFTLISGKDGQRSQPLEPGQLAGKGSIMVSRQTVYGGGMGQSRGPW